MNLFECKVNNATITELTCNSRIRHAGKHRNHPHNNQLIDQGKNCRKCKRGQKIIEKYNINLDPKKKVCSKCGLTEPKVKFHERKHICSKCQIKYFAEYRDNRKSTELTWRTRKVG